MLGSNANYDESHRNRDLSSEYYMENLPYQILRKMFVLCFENFGSLGIL